MACVALEGWNIFQLEDDSSGIEGHIEQVVAVAFGMTVASGMVVAWASAFGCTSDIAFENELVLLQELVVS